MVSSHSRGLQTRLYMLVFAVVVPALGAIAIHAMQDRRSSVEQAGRELQRLAQTVALDYRFLAENERRFLSAFAQLPQIRAAAAGCDRIAANLLGQSNRHVNLGVADERGTVRCSALPTAGTAIETASFRKAVVSKDFIAGNIRIDRVPGNASLDFGLPIVDGKGSATAVAFSAVNFAWLAESVGRVPLPAATHLLLVGADGTVIARRPDGDGAVGKPIADASLHRSVLQQPQGGVARGFGAGEAMQLVGFTPLATGADRPTAHVLAAMPLESVYAEPNRRLLWNLGMLSATTMLMCLIVRWLGSRLVLRPVDALARAVERFGGGDMSARTGLSHGKGELGRLARGFDELAERVERQAAEQRRSEESIRRLHRGYMLFTRVNYAIVHQRERTALLRELCCILAEDGGFALAWVGWENGAHRLDPVAHYGTDRRFEGEFSLPPDAGLHPGLRALREQRTVICNDIDKVAPGEPWRAFMSNFGQRAWAAFPLRMEGRVVAALNLHSLETGVFDVDEQRLIAEIASDMSFALDTMRQEQQRREAEKRLTFIAYHDPVTELPNLLHYDELIKGLYERACASGRPFASMIVGIERLQEVTATFGYNVEGELLRLIGQRLRQCTRVGDVLARGAGSNFNLAFPDTDVDMAMRTAHHVLKVMQQPFAIQGMDIELGVAIGIALHPDHGDAPDVLNRCAYTALTQARKTGCGHVLYSPGQELFTPERLALVSELRHAIDNDRLALAYQPKIDLASGDIAGVEALIRWTHPVRGALAPEQFILVAEQTGLIRALTDWVIETVTKQSHQFARAGYRLPVAINLSTLNLIDPHLPARLYNHCLAWSVDPSAIELEITESSLMQDPSGTLQVLQRLSETGYLLYIDDFGTGYSSLSYLKKLAVDALKIDKSFVLDMLADRDAYQIVRSTIDLAHDLGLKVVAEGVETQETLARLRALGCDMVQGSHIAPPMTAGDLVNWLATTTWHARPVNTRVMPRGGKNNGSARRGSRKKAL